MEKKVKDLSVYRKHFDNDATTFSEIDASDFIRELNKQGLYDEAIEVGKTFMSASPNLNRYINQYGYALYNKFIKVDDEKIKEKENLYKSIFEEITDLCVQENYSPYEPTVNRTIKYILNNKPVNYALLSELLDKLNPLELDEKPFVNEKGKEFESKKEKWFRLKVRACYENKDYEKCIENSNIAFTLSIKWHYSNLQWIKYYRAMSLVELKRYNEAYNELLTLKNRFNQVNFDTLYTLALNNNKKNDAYTSLIYEFFISGYSYDNINIYNYILDMVKEKNVEFILKSASALVYKLNKENGKDVEVEADISQYEDKNSSQVYDILYEQLMEHLNEFISRKRGKVTFYNQEREFGSIATHGKDNVFFKQADYIYDEDVEVRDYVEYSIMKTYDIKKDRVTTRAVLIKAL